MITTDIFKYEKGGVWISEDGMDIPEIKSFYDSDKKYGKPKFNAYMRALYFMYSKGSPYYNMSYEEKLSSIESRHIGMRKWNNMVSDPLFKSIVDIYISITTTKEERQYKKQMDRILEDIDNQIDRLSRIPTVRKEKVIIDVRNDDGTVEKREVYLDIINEEERNRAIKALKQAYDLQDYIKEKIKYYEVGISTQKDYVPLFDDPKN